MTAHIAQRLRARAEREERAFATDPDCYHGAETARVLREEADAIEAEALQYGGPVPTVVTTNTTITGELWGECPGPIGTDGRCTTCGIWPAATGGAHPRRIA